MLAVVFPLLHPPGFSPRSQPGGGPSQPRFLQGGSVALTRFRRPCAGHRALPCPPSPGEPWQRKCRLAPRVRACFLPFLLVTFELSRCSEVGLPPAVGTLLFVIINSVPSLLECPPPRPSCLPSWSRWTGPATQPAWHPAPGFSPPTRCFEAGECLSAGLKGWGGGCGRTLLVFTLQSLCCSLSSLVCLDLFCLPFGTKQYSTKCPLNILILLYHMTS